MLLVRLTASASEAVVMIWRRHSSQCLRSQAVGRLLDPLPLGTIGRSWRRCRPHPHAGERGADRPALQCPYLWHEL